jgi:glycine/D-amino acid oxidase-like deaminating enzyme
MRVGIVGGGTFGSIIGRALKEEGCKVTIFDCRRSEAASRASGFLMKPSWFDGLGKKITDPALELLDKFYGLQKIKFRMGPLRTFAYRVDREAVLDDPKLHYIEEKVTKVQPRVLTLKNGEEHEFDTVILAAGVWSKNLISIPGLEGKKGISFEWKGQHIKRSRIRPWAPYKQVVVFNVPDTNIVWGGDGSAILAENWKEERDEECLERVSKLAGLDGEEATRRTGIRPYIEGMKPCLLETRGKHLWVATGGAKNGTIAAAWAAYKLAKELSNG